MGQQDQARQARDKFARQLSDARSGCPQALGDLLQGCHRFLLIAANQALESTLRPKQGASDFVQETCYLAQREFATFRGTTPEELSAWLHKILERQLKSHSRAFRQTERRRIHREIPVEQTADLQDHRLPVSSQHLAGFELQEEYEKVQRAMALLPADYREVIELRAWHRLPFRQIASRMERSIGAVEKLWSRAVERLQAQLRDQL